MLRVVVCCGLGDREWITGCSIRRITPQDRAARAHRVGKIADFETLSADPLENVAGSSGISRYSRRSRKARPSFGDRSAASIVRDSVVAEEVAAPLIN